MKRLIFRLSSLGDIILAQSSLEVPYAGETHWVVAHEFRDLLRGHPRVTRLWEFDRKKSSSLKAWLLLIQELHAHGFTEVLDLHCTLRTRIARAYFLICDLRQKNFHSFKNRRWRTLSKGRIRRCLYILFKQFLPKKLRPRHLTTSCSLLAGASRGLVPNLSWLVSNQKSLANARRGEGIPAEVSDVFLRLQIDKTIDTTDETLDYLALAPSSAWKQKEWPAEKYTVALGELLKNNPSLRVVILGARGDETAQAVSHSFAAAGIQFIDAIGRLNLPEVAEVISQCKLLISPDTGLAHLSESVGTPVLVLFGPTRVDFGFGPQLQESRAVHGPVRCSPCSKDGTLCYRVGDRYGCLRRMSPNKVRNEIVETLKKQGISCAGYGVEASKVITRE